MSRRFPLPTLGFVATMLFSLPALGGTLAQLPLTLQSSVPSNVLFSLSVEFPTANTAAYQDTNGYLDTNTYLGIFDSEKCYDYDSANGWFNPISWATNHDCTGHWSGSFLNWASMTGLDEFRHAMTGGNRVQDTATLTVLQRSYQSGQGGTANFPNKTYSGNTATPYPATASLTISNQGRGTQMNVALGGSGVADCANPTLTGGTFSCSITMQSTNETGSCTAWSGSGTSASPYACTTFAPFAGSGTPSAISNGTKSSASITSTDTVSCTNPTYGGSFNCTLTDSGGTTGACTTWIGTGTSTSPFSCSNFSTFGTSSFSQSSQGNAATFSSTASTTETPSSCSYASSKITCNLPSGRTTSCTTTGAGSSTNPYRCQNNSATWNISGTPTATETGFVNSGSTSGSGSNKYSKPTSVTYSTPATYYYIPSYTGSDSLTYYYYSTYNLTFGGATNYNVHVKVCASTALNETNCKLYSNGTTYKPIGQIQAYGDKMRFGAFSYYNANDVDNAVMRSKAKYVAPNKWTASGTTSNSNKEWSDTDGTFVTNPDPTEAAASFGGAVTNSGVINYINKFGSVAHSYKTYDNVGKLYYETLKYLRGLQPTTDFHNLSSPTNNDNFPVITTWDDPVQYSCQKNFIITMGDTHTWCDKRLPGGLFTTAGGQCGPYNGQTADSGSLGGDTGVDVGLWTQKLGTLESKGTLATTATQNTASFYMSGLAYWANYNGFRTFSDGTLMKAQTFVIDVQENKDLGVNSQYWYAAKYGGASKFNSNGSPWDSTVNATPATTLPDADSWWKSSTQSTAKWPKNLLPAGDPQSMINAVNSAFVAIAAQSSSSSAAGISSGTLDSSNGTNAYSTKFDSNGWYGDVMSSHIDTTLTVTSSWKASTYLNPTALNPSSGTAPWITRRVLTFNDGLNANGNANTNADGRQGVDFKATTTSSNVFSTNFSPLQQSLLSLDPGVAPSSNGVGSDRVDYLRGDNSNEGTNGEQWRVRTGSLGDFVHSSPLYVRYPSFADIPAADATSFNSYVTAVASRTPVVYAGANDGMLHAFDASDISDNPPPPPATSVGPTANSGKELLAYVPAAVYANLKNLSSTNYSHTYYVDSTPVVADAQLSSGACTASSDATKCWRTIITGGLNAGGQGIYALNATDPSSFATAIAKSLVLWEFTDRDDADLGNTFSQPLVRKMNNGKWAVIVGNGYNNTDADGRVSATGRAYMFILMLDGPGFSSSGRGKDWTLGTNYYKIELTAPNEGSTTPVSPANGLSTVFGIDKNEDNVVDYLYAGDRYGNVWKIDVSSANPSAWGSSFGTSTTPLPLFTAVTSDSTPKAQQITTSPMVAPNPNGGFMVLFGTGSFVDTTDNTSPFVTESFYGIWDKDDGTRVTRSMLQKQATLAFDSTSGDSLQSQCGVQYSSTPTAPVTATTRCPASLAPSLNVGGNVDQQFGWVIDLNYNLSSSNTGERYISTPLPILINGRLQFRTITPSGSACGGSFTDREYNLNYLSGGAYSQPIYYNFSGTTATAITTSFTIGGATVSAYPSGKTVNGAGTGQNPPGFTTTGTTPYNSTTGCTFVPGRPCKNPNWNCSVTAGTPPTISCVKAPATGRVSWHQIMQ